MDNIKFEPEKISKQEIEDDIVYDILSEDFDKENENKKEKAKIKKLKHKKREEQRQRREVRMLRLKSVLTIKTVLLLILTLLANTYAWFVYVNQVNTTLEMHVRSWNFTIVDDQQDEQFKFVIDNVNPGMPEAVRNINTKNNGEMKARVACEILQVRLFDTVYKVGDINPETGQGYTSEELFKKLAFKFPFKVETYVNDIFYIGGEEVLSTGGSSKITFKVNWPYENALSVTDGDIADTEWGNKSYEFMKNNPDKSSIEITFRVIATQAEK